MSAPTQPTTTTICTEALKRFLNGSTPTGTDITRAIAYGLEKVKRDIMHLGRKWRPLLTTYYEIIPDGFSHYDNPSDFEIDFSAHLLRGTSNALIGTVVDTTHITLAATESITAANAIGRWLVMLGGTAARMASQIVDYSATTKICRLSFPFTTATVTGDEYLIATQVSELRYKHPRLYDKYDHPGSPGTPKIYTNLKNSTYGYFVLYPVPNMGSGVGCRRIYYADLMRVDTSSGLYSTILRRWAGVFEQGVYVWKLSEDDDRYPQEAQAYSTMLQMMAINDLDGQPTIQGQPVSGSTKAS